jgi:hypothetical protein
MNCTCTDNFACTNCRTAYDVFVAGSHFQALGEPIGEQLITLATELETKLKPKGDEHEKGSNLSEQVPQGA